MIYQEIFNYPSKNLFEEKLYSELDKSYNNIQELLQILKEKLSILNEENNIKQIQKTDDFKNSNNNIKLKKQRGRPKKNIELKVIHIHSKMSYDNICQKLKVLYHHFLVNLCNDYIRASYKGFQKFRLRKVRSFITQNVTRKYNQELSTWNLKHFFSNQISTKYKRFSENKNEENINKLCLFRPKVKELFMMNYFDAYKNLFIYGKRNELRIKYGISDKTLLFNDCLEKIKLKESEEYAKRMDEIAKGKLMLIMKNGKELNVSSCDSSNEIINLQKKEK